MKRIIFLMLIVIMLTGCNAAPTFIQPEGKVTLDKSEYIMNIGEFKWKEHDFETSKIRTSDNYELAGEFSTLEGDKGEELSFEIDQYPTSIIVNKWNTDLTSDSIEVKDNKFTLPLEGGYYIYEVIVEWPQGKAIYIFDVDVK
ncbi:membrane lipoprotein lipid attachment site-containing protein [Psychrobacillus psychrodurans]|uniref:membrane lipoprotein lipid attachment site-containing protein n=1 Tax=Psychrobacillus psychrodurans TaxID=126157 RepID=UPI000B876242|nr:membrane lipoprotein lipid attachment site-containing protein [Psychrobacillus psychrodurans]MCZ8542323.1 membrane lipoprotein lipid attachment site-containing protein [Psychrobacillus psychrodurans]